jgi:hypothetical protein
MLIGNVAKFVGRGDDPVEQGCLEGGKVAVFPVGKLWRQHEMVVEGLT